MRTIDPSIDAPPVSPYEVETRINVYRRRLLVACLRRDWSASIFDAALDVRTGVCAFPGCGRPLKRGIGALCTGHVKQRERAAALGVPCVLRPLNPRPGRVAAVVCDRCGGPRERSSAGVMRCLPCQRAQKLADARARGVRPREPKAPDTSAPPCTHCGSYRTRQGREGNLRCIPCLKRRLAARSAS